MRQFKALKIIHNLKDRIEFTFFVEFFRICGVYTGEFVWSEKHRDEKDLQEQGFDAALYVGLDKEAAEQLPKETICLRTILDARNIPAAPHMSGRSEAEQKAILSEVLAQLAKILEDSGIAFDLCSFQKLADIYVKYHLMIHCANLQYYRMNCEKLDEGQSAFKDAGAEILSQAGLQEADVTKLSEDGKATLTSQRVFCYAALYCANQVNSVCNFREYPFWYQVEQLGDFCLDFARQCNDFSNVWVLLGLIYVYSPEYWREAIASFERALEEERELSYSTHIYYWIGKLYDSYDRNLAEAEKVFEESSRKKRRYRSLYMQGVVARKLKKWKDMLAYFDETFEQLQERGDYLDPLELAYYYKVNSFACDVCCTKLQEYDRAVRYGERAEEFYKKLENDAFFEDFYGTKEANEYREICKKRMRLYTVFGRMAISYRNLGREDKEKEYWLKLREYDLTDMV